MPSFHVIVVLVFLLELYRPLIMFAVLCQKWLLAMHLNICTWIVISLRWRWFVRML